MSNEIKQSFEKRISQSISQIHELQKEDDADEIIANLSKYLCILISGYTEKVFINSLVQYFSIRRVPKIAKFVANTHKHTTNLTMKKILEILNSFDKEWEDKLKSSTSFDEYNAAVSSIYENRNKIAHGEVTTVTVSRLENWYKNIKDMIDEIIKIVNKS